MSRITRKLFAPSTIASPTHRALTQAPGNRIVVHIEAGSVLLEGTVESDEMRALAEDVVRSVLGVQIVDNQLSTSAPASHLIH